MEKNEVTYILKVKGCSKNVEISQVSKGLSRKDIIVILKNSIDHLIKEIEDGKE